MRVQRQQYGRYQPVEVGWSGQVKEYSEERFYGETGEYRHRHIYAIGHGAAVRWTQQAGGAVTEIATDFMPAVEVPQVSTEVSGIAPEVLDFAALSRCGEQTAAVVPLLDRFVHQYADWVGLQQVQAKSFADPHERQAAERLVVRMQESVQRMRDGVALLQREVSVARFCACR